jgi:glycosyltransferase involved in cell wall biosynthesis
VRIAFHAPRAAYLKSYTSGDTANVQNFIAGLQRLGHEVRIVSRVNVRRFWQRRLSIWQMAAEARRVWRAMKDFAPDAWLVYNSSVTDPDLFGWWLCRNRYVLLNTRLGHGRRLPRVWRGLFTLAHRRSIMRADSVAADRPAHIDALRNCGIPAERLYLLPSPAGGLGQLPSQIDARTQLGLPSDAPIILCVTRLPPLGWGARKTERVLDLVRSFSELPDRCILVIVGGGEGQSHVEDDIRRFGIGARIHLAGTVPHDNVRWYYSACDFYAYPFPEDLPFVAIVEAQAAGRPVVVMRSPSTETIVVDRHTGLLADDLEQFTKYMAALAADRARCASMGEIARVYVSTYHSSDTRVKQLEALLMGNAIGAVSPTTPSQVTSVALPEQIHAESR